MGKKSLVIVSISLVLLGAGWGVHLLTSKSPEKSGTQTTGNKAKIINVDDVVSSPEKFAGVIGVEGTVTKVDEANSEFTLGCEDACILMPVKFDGRPPKEGANVIAYGEVKKTEQGKYIFVAQEIKAK
ncbi:hypothetical protein D4R75_05320 [bacterium]|nr:MAG: hypothetical protein D4R75_05320 [bacterium]